MALTDDTAGVDVPSAVERLIVSCCQSLSMIQRMDICNNHDTSSRGVSFEGQLAKCARFS